jgi:hypothetical protein
MWNSTITKTGLLCVWVVAVAQVSARAGVPLAVVAGPCPQECGKCRGRVYGFDAAALVSWGFELNDAPFEFVDGIEGVPALPRPSRRWVDIRGDPHLEARATDCGQFAAQVTQESRGLEFMLTAASPAE